MNKPIKDYENYLIYDNGDVLNTITNKILRGSIGDNGYKYYRLSKNGTKRMFYAHRLVAEHFLDNKNNYPVINHIDGNKLNNNVTNLEWTTYSNNTTQWHQLKQENKVQKREYYKKDLPDEEWKEYKNYLVSSCGRIRRKNTNNLLRPSITGGYYKVRLSENGLVEDVFIHKLVYKLFIDDTDFDTKKFIIDHIDGNKLNNKVNNLRKISLSENVLAALYQQKTNSSAKKVAQYDLNGNFIAEFPSAKEAARVLNLDSSTISKVCRGKNKTHGGFIFKYI